MKIDVLSEVQQFLNTHLPKPKIVGISLVGYKGMVLFSGDKVNFNIREEDETPSESAMMSIPCCCNGGISDVK